MKKTARIAIFGSSLISAYSNGRATYYRGLLKALHRHGFDITFYEPNAYHRQSTRDIPNPTWAKVVIYPATFTGLLQSLQAARGADIVIKTSDVGVFDRELDSAIAEGGRSSRMSVYWDVDPAENLERVQRNEKDAFRALIPNFDLILTLGGGDAAVRAYKELGARECAVVYSALDPMAHFPVLFDPRFTATLGFLGNRRPDRSHRVEELFLGVARVLPEKRFVLGGSGWDQGGKLPGNVSRVGYVAARDHNVFNCSPLAILNVNRDMKSPYDFSPSARIFEAAGAGACLVCEEMEGIECFLEPGREVFTVKTGIDVISTLSMLTPALARSMGLAARRRILSEHTYANRAAVLSRILEGSDRQSKSVPAVALSIFPEQLSEPIRERSGMQQETRM